MFLKLLFQKTKIAEENLGLFGWVSWLPVFCILCLVFLHKISSIATDKTIAVIVYPSLKSMKVGCTRILFFQLLKNLKRVRLMRFCLKTILNVSENKFLSIIYTVILCVYIKGVIEIHHAFFWSRWVWFLVSWKLFWSNKLRSGITALAKHWHDNKNVSYFSLQVEFPRVN